MDENPYQAPGESDPPSSTPKERWRFSRTRWHHWFALFVYLGMLIATILEAIRTGLR